MIENGKEITLENGGEVALNCSCCGVSLETKFSTPYMLIKLDLEYTHKGNLIIEANDLFEKGDNLNQNRSDEDKIEKNGDNQLLSSDVKKLEGEKVHLVLEGMTEYIEEKYKKKMLKDEGCEIEDAAPPQHLEFFIDCSGHMLVPVELIHQDVKEEVKAVVEEKAEVCLGGSEREPEFAVVESMDNDLVFYAKECQEVYEQFSNAEEASTYHQVQILAAKEREEEKEENSDVSSEEMPNNETDREVSIGTEIPDLDQADEALTSYIHEEPSRNSAHFYQVIKKMK